MTKLVCEHIDFSDCASLDALIERLAALRDSLPEQAEAAVASCAISYMRPQTAEEAGREARYSAAYVEARERVLARLRGAPGETWKARRGAHLRSVA